MRFRLQLLFLATFLLTALAVADDKQKVRLPDFVLKARTVLVLIDPEAGTPMTAPMANKAAQDDVEKALSKWGRFSPVLAGMQADLIITVRKGSGKIVQPTIGGQPTNDRPVIVQPNDNGIRVGVQQGHPLGTPETSPRDSGPHPQVEATSSPDDIFTVYDGSMGVRLDSASVWRYTGKNALRSPDVPAVGEFRKVIEAAAKQHKTKP